jgi:anhydro-N-acetylmuramic acid kinase
MALPPCCIGLMSGTSLDGVDGALVDFSGASPRVLAFDSRPYPEPLRQAFLSLNQVGHNELHRCAEAAHDLAVLSAELVLSLLAQQGIPRDEVAAIGAHGQTLRHQPHGSRPYTWQAHQPAVLAERTGLPVVADFRSRDVAAGGQGAPLVPAFHREVFARPGRSVAVVNIGGMANLTVLRADGAVLGLDTGPGNVLLDLWCHRHTGAWYDHQGAWAATGRVQSGLLADMLAEPYFHRSGVKSTGRDLFHEGWLQRHLEGWPGVSAADVQATLTELTAHTVAQAVANAPWGADLPQEVVVCGGGSRNTALMDRLRAHLSPVPVTDSAAQAWPAQWVEAAAFAWLARQTLLGQAGNVCAVTGASGPRVLGCVYPA